MSFRRTCSHNWCNFFQDVGVDKENVDGTDTNIEDDVASPPVSTDPKKAKAEQKRLEKEEREREKKRKQEEKRQSKENAQKTKADALSRKQERDEKKQKGGIANFMSPARKTARPKNTVRGRVLLLDGSEIEVEIEVTIFFDIMFVASLISK